MNSEEIPNNSNSPKDDSSSTTADDLKPKSEKTPLYVILAGIFLTLLVIACLQVDDWGRDWANNYAETSEESVDVNLRPIEADMPAKELAELVVNWMEKMKRWTVDSRSESGGKYKIHLVHKTYWLGFKDDIHVEIVTTTEGSRLTATSQSRIGKGDLGQNPRNLKELIARIRKGIDALNESE